MRQIFVNQKRDRILEGIKSSVITIFIFCALTSILVFVFAEPLISAFIDDENRKIIKIGTQYLHIEGSMYFGIGLLFILYGFFRAVSKPQMSVVLTVISLGTRVLLAYPLSSISFIGVAGICLSVPIGWILADITGCIAMKKYFNQNK